MNRTVMYTDGACSPLTWFGGWAWWVDDEHWKMGAVEATTSNRMELTAVIEGLAWASEHLPDTPLLVVTDSLYVVNCIHNGWYVRWRESGWLSSTNDRVRNRDLWEQFLIGWETHPAPVTFRHVRGHGKGGVGDAPYVEGNRNADRLAVQARKTLETKKPKRVRPPKGSPYWRQNSLNQ